jgi:cullin 3
MSSSAHAEVEELYREIHEVGVVRFLDNIENERRANLTAAEINTLYQKGFSIATRAAPVDSGAFEPPEWFCHRYIDEVLTYVRNTVVPSLKAALSTGPQGLLREWSRRWRYFRHFIKGIWTVFMYLDRFHTKGMDMDLKEAAYNIFFRALWHGLTDSDTVASLAPSLRSYPVASLAYGGGASGSVGTAASGSSAQSAAALTASALNRAAPATATEAATAAAAAAAAAPSDNHGIIKAVIDSIAALIDGDRRGEAVDTALLRTSIAVFTELGQELAELKVSVKESLRLYAALETRIDESTRLFYTAAGAEWLDQLTGAEYFARVDDVLAAEEARVKLYLHRSTERGIEHTTYEPLVLANINALVERPSYVKKILDDDCTEDVRRMFRLLMQNAHCQKIFSQRIFNYIKDVGAALVQGSEVKTIAAKEKREAQVKERAQAALAYQQEVAAAQAAGTAPPPAPKPLPPLPPLAQLEHAIVTQLVTDLIVLHNRYMASVNESKGEIKAQVRLAFETFINIDDRVAKALTEYANEVLRKGCTLNLVSAEDALANIVALYGFVKEKDVFEHEYQKHLQARLLDGMSASETNEKHMITLLKAQSGYNWTSRLETMFNDMASSRTFTSQLMQTRMRTGRGPLRTASGGEFELEVTVCTSGNWPLPPTQSRGRVPAELEEATRDFAAAYVNQHQGRKLTWRLDQGTAELTVTFNPTTTCTLVVTSLMMAALLAFNDARVVTFAAITRTVDADVHELQHHVQSLVARRVLITKKAGNIANDTELMINPRFTSTMTKFAVPLVRPVTQKDLDEDRAKVDINRTHACDAAIVRILKARKEMAHNLLVAEVIRQLSVRFNPDPPFIKKRIDALIQQQYMTRDENDRQKYIYVA